MPAAYADDVNSKLLIIVATSLVRISMMYSPFVIFYFAMNSTHTKKTPLSTHWGAGIAEVVDGKLQQVNDHPIDPDPSPINRNLAGSLYGKARIKRPAIRRGFLNNEPLTAANARGKDSFVEVDWDTALDLVSEKLRHTIANYGNESIFGGSYGWASAGRFHHAQSQLKRFLNAAGGFVRSEGNYSYNAALVLMPHIVGNFRDHVRQATRWTTVQQHGQLVVMFGGVPLRNAQVSGGGIAQHRLRDDLLACKQAGVKFVNFSPLRSDAIEELQAEWLPPIPGSDTAIILGLAHTLLVENLHDEAFLARYTVGFERVRAYLLGQTDGIAKDAAWAEQQSGIKAERLITLARQMAAQRTLICTAAGLQRTEYGEQPLWATVTLSAMLGQVGLPGGGYGIGYGADASIGTVDRPLRWPSFPIGDYPVDDYIPVATIADMLLNPGQAYEYNGEQRTYPHARLVWWAGGNPFHHHQDLNRLHHAFQQPDTIIVNEINWTATARHADIVLPVASMLERTDFGAGNQDNTLIPMPQAIAPVAEAREEYAIYCELEKRLQLNAAFSGGKTAEQWQETLWQQLRQEAKAQDYDLPGWESFLAGDIIELNDPAPEAVFLADFRADPEQHPLPTPSGKIELYSEVIAGFNYADCPGQASWLPPREWLGAANTSADDFHLISGQPATRLHSQFDNGAYSISLKKHGREPVLIHPTDAERLGIAGGDIVQLSNARGRCLAAAVLSNDIMPRVVFLWTGAWYDPDFNHPQQLERHGNPNVLTHDYRTSRLSQGPAAHSALVRLEKFEGELPEVRAFMPPFGRVQGIAEGDVL
ncbi:MAG: molybdopterin-dependent oxidoreductase [Thiolinea sp.]